MGRSERYGIVLDAGSSGTRIYIYKWNEHRYARKIAKPDELKLLPKIETKKKWTLKQKPGVSTFGSKPYQVGEYLKPLLDHAKSIIPKDAVADTPLFLLATAGVRLLKSTEQKILLDQICSYTRQHSNFLLPDCDLHVQVISGETEGLYGWISANYLLGGFDNSKEHDHGKGHHTYGFLDMGGASAQIAFEPNSTEVRKHKDDLTMLRLRTIDGTPREHQVFVTTWLGFGMNEARVLYIKRLQEASGGHGIKELPDPCIPHGLSLTLEGETDLRKKKHPKDPIVVGTGKFDECLRTTYPLLQKDVPCMDSPCLLKGVHVPEIDFEVNHFVGVSEYWHTTHEIFDFGEDHPYDFTAYQTKVKEFCAQDWKSIKTGISKKKWGKKVDEQKAREVCFKASWLTNIMHEGIGIPRIGIETSSTHNVTDAVKEAKAKGFMDPFKAVDKINGVELSWTLGKIVLYASSQIPAAVGLTSLPVGFGSNSRTDAIPSDWQHAGSDLTLPPSSSSSHPPVYNATADDDAWSSDPLNPPRKSFGPSSLFLFLFLLVSILLLLFINKDRRNRTFRRLGSIVNSHSAHTIKHKLRRARRKILSPLSASPGPTYERVMEDGYVADHAVFEFELGGTSDDEGSYSDDSTKGGRSIWGGGPQISRPATAPSPTESVGMLAMGKKRSKAQLRAGSTGLMVRTDSRERLARSRDVSPSGGLRSATRARSPLPRMD